MQQMKKLVTSVLFACVWSGPVLADSSNTQSKDPAIIDAVKQVGQDMGDAMVAGDVEKLKKIYADDFAEVGSSGKVTTKQDLLKDFASFHDKLTWFENGPIDVQVFGDIAMAQGSVKEKRSKNGKDTGGDFMWMDLLEKHAGKWLVLRSAGARVVSADSSKASTQGPTVDTIKQLEKDMGDAMIAVDIAKLNQIFANDWAMIGSSGKMFTKESLFGDLRSGKSKLEWFEIGPMNVQVLGNVAVVQAGVDEKRLQDGKDTSGKFVFMDLLEKRAGHWVVFRTLGSRVK
jgi:ketosteroid isomerase-like protein